MAKPGERKINRTCTYVSSSGMPRPAIITALNGASNVDLRVGHHGETYTNVAEMAKRENVGVWVPGSVNRYPYNQRRDIWPAKETETGVSVAVT